MNLLALRNLFHDKIRFVVTLTGIVFAVLLIAVQLGLFIGFTGTTSNVIDHANADLWITSKGVKNFDAGSPISERKLYPVLATPGVAQAENEIVCEANWKRPDGVSEYVEVVGFNPAKGIGRPWNLVAGSMQELASANSVVIDESYREKLGVSHPGQLVEINGHRARVVGFTRGIRSFTTQPFVFTSFKNALNYASLTADQTVYILVKAAAGVDLQELKCRLAGRLSGVSVFTTAEFRNRTRFYWMFTTGAGIALIVAALMGLIVGIVVVAQTIYATTLDHLREIGTLRAMGASNRYLYRVILGQAAISAMIGYVLGMAISLVVSAVGRHCGAIIALPWELAAVMLVVTLLMCSSAAIVSIHRVTRLDPAMVFRN